MIRIITFLLLLPLHLLAQFQYKMDFSIPVKNQDGVNYQMPWAGGLNAAQFNTIDINGDEQEDLVLFDRHVDRIIPFLQKEGAYEYAPGYALLFPESEVVSWMLLRDFNCDGRKDLFTADPLGIKVYKNVSDHPDTLMWERQTFFVGDNLPKQSVLMTMGSSSFVNIQLQFDDIPSISDVDGDGDLDIFIMTYPSGHTIEFHENIREDFGFPCDSVRFKRIVREWGNIRECSCGVFAFNGNVCPTGGRKNHIGGKSLLALHSNSDNNIDLLFGEADCNQLFLLENEGTLDAPVINDAVPYPVESPVELNSFPGAYYEDVNFDGVKDLLVTPSFREKENLETDLSASTWHYSNIGTTAEPSFSFTQSSFLQSEMIDVGDNASPAFVDEDGDGDLDMFVANHATSDGFARMILYENNGTITNPSFIIADEDYLNFSAFSFYNLKIQFADINNDNNEDLIFTASTETPPGTHLYYLENSSQGGLDLSSQPVRITFPVLSTENIHVTPVDSDDLPDIILGRNTGSLELWKNIGSSDAPSFSLEQENFLGIGSSITQQNLAVHSADLNADGNDDLVMGDDNGKLSIISNYKSSASHVAENNILFNNLVGHFGEARFGAYARPVGCNLFNLSRPQIVIGNALGGIQVMRSLGEFSITPTLVDKNGYLTITPDDDLQLNIYTPTGQKVMGPIYFKNGMTMTSTVQGLSAGLYIFRFKGNKKSFSRKIVVR